MVIGLDIDDVIFDTSGVMRNILGDIKDKELIDRKIDVMRGDASIPVIAKFLKKYLIVAVENARPMPDAAKVIHDLREQGHKIVLITARGDKNFPGTLAGNEKALTKYGVEYDVIVYDSADKVDACRKNGVEVFVDDSPRNCVEVARELKIPVIGFASDITREGLREAGVVSTDSWADLAKMILDLVKK